MQTGKFSIFDFDKLQDPNKKENYDKIICWANMVRSSRVRYSYLNYDTLDGSKMIIDLPLAYYIKRANEIIKLTNERSAEHAPASLKTVNDKILFVTNVAFPDNQKFINILERYGIEKESCINFGEEIKKLHSYEEQQRATILELLMQECFPNLNLIKTHYGINSTGVIINKILEIAYLHPELLHTKEKS